MSGKRDRYSGIFTISRQASEELLFDQACRRVRRLLEEGVTTLEIKSGYGLSLEQELKMLRVARRIGEAS